MLRECRDHGYFREAKCQYCGEEGRFLMSENNLDRFGRILAGVLRHFPDRFDLVMDRQGWVRVNDLVKAIKQQRTDMRWLTREHVEAVVQTDPKGRYQLEAGRVRATYGHSLDLDLDLPTENIPNTLFYPTNQDEVEHLAVNGLFPSDRQMVHLSRTRVDALNAAQYRPGRPVVLQIDARRAIQEGLVIMQAGKTVFLCERVPSEYLSRLGPEPPEP